MPAATGQAPPDRAFVHPRFPIGARIRRPVDQTGPMMKTYMCVICGLIYDEAQGWPNDGIAAGTLWDDVPLTWKCPECGAGKDDFEMVEV